MIADLAGALGALYEPSRGQRGQRAIGRTFHVNVGARRQPALLEPTADVVQQRRVERRIEKDDIEGLRRALQESLRVLDRHGCVAAAEPLERLRQMATDLRLAIHE